MTRSPFKCKLSFPALVTEVVVHVVRVYLLNIFFYPFASAVNEINVFVLVSSLVCLF